MTHHIHHSTDHYVCLSCGIRFKSTADALDHSFAHVALETEEDNAI
jgi:hypothetical protein